MNCVHEVGTVFYIVDGSDDLPVLEVFRMSVPPPGVPCEHGR